MKTKHSMVVFACLALLMSGCGSSSSDDNNKPQLKTAEQEYIDFCARNPSSEQCNDANDTADDLGFGNYYGGGNDAGYGDPAFGGHPSGAGCGYNECEVAYRGVPRCESIEHYREASSNQVSMRYVKRPNGKEKLWVAFDSDEHREVEGIRTGGGNTGSCNSGQVRGTRCQSDRDCHYSDQHGYRVRAQCVSMGGGLPYGYCQAIH